MTADTALTLEFSTVYVWTTADDGKRKCIISKCFTLLFFNKRNGL